MTTDLALYLGLFWNAFLAATLLPAFSELALAGLLKAEMGTPSVLLFFATAGNVAGSVVNWGMGRSLNRFQHRRWFPFKAEKLQRAQAQFARFGYWSLLFSWLPIVGDPLTLVAGMLRTPFFLFLPLVITGKALRYAVIIISISGSF